MNKPYLGVLLVLICFLVSSTDTDLLAQGQPGLAETPSTPVPGWSVRLDAASEGIDAPKPTDEILSRLRDELESIRGEAREWIADQTPIVEKVQEELEALGPPPGEDQEPEAAGVTAQRQALKARLAATAGPVTEAELIVGRAGVLIAQIGEIRRKRLAERIMARGPSPLSPAVWKLALPELSSMARSISASATNLVASARFHERLR